MNIQQLQMYIAGITIIVIIDFILKGVALWKAGKHAQKAWFICLFIFNTAGILPLVYLLFFQKKQA